MKKEDWFSCPAEGCSEPLDIKGCTHWEIVMYCSKCGTCVILKRYIGGNFNCIFTPYSELSEKQREYLKGEKEV